MTAPQRLSAGLRHALEPLQAFLAEDGVEELFINRPGEVFVKRDEGTRVVAVPQLSLDDCMGLCILAANARDQRLSEESPLLTTALPFDPNFCDAQLRFTAVIPPCVEPGQISISIRKQSVRDFAVADLASNGLFRATQLRNRLSAPLELEGTAIEAEGKIQTRRRKRKLPPCPAAEEAAAEGDVPALLTALVRAHRNILVSGATGSGKTTLLNALAKAIPDSERIVSIEDARELRCSQPNRVHLLAPSNDGGLANVTARDLLRHMLRMSPQRALLSEIRGAEAYTYLEALNTGHPGSLSTIHADSAEDAKVRLAMAAARAFDGLRDEDMRELVEEYVDVFIHVQPAKGGRLVPEIEWL